MVEKIIINPNKVRGYGNIMNSHSSTDYELSDCTITETTDTVNGATETVYELEDTILFFDPCRTNANQSDGYYTSVGTTTFDDEGLTLTSAYNNNEYQVNCRMLNQTVTVPFEISFDILDLNQNNFRMYFYNNGFSTSIASSSVYQNPNGSTTHVVFTVTSEGITRTVGGSTSTVTSTSITNPVGARWGYYQNSNGYLKIRNYKVKSI